MVLTAVVSNSAGMLTLVALLLLAGIGVLSSLMYGTGMRLMECGRSRVADGDFGQQLIVVRDGNGGKDPIVPSPQRPQVPLRGHLERVKGRQAGVVPVKRPVDTT
jgi:integrase